ncbi:Pyridine nucleotide-disulfide oxidoreductase [Gracilaria domingensis]|nr:Pyridine nucleotide-disulfide oxidoreductase [Gracilaria domingensis]
MLSAQIRSMASAASTFKYIILGAGNAAGYAARQFVEMGLQPGELCLIGSEPYFPYERPALSKGVLMNPKARLPGFHTCVGSGGDRQPPEWYEQHGIAAKLGKPVVKFDAASKSVVIEGDETVSATDAIILATGAQPIRLTKTEGHHLKGIHYLRENDEGVALAEALDANKGKQIIVVGGGYIGMEVAAAAMTVGCQVKLVFPEEHIMPRLFTPEIAVHYEKVYKDKGAIFLNNGRLCKAFLGDADGHVRGAMICQKTAGDLEEDGSLIVVGVGARPETELYKGQLLMDERGGVITDATLKTSADGVYAVGDIANYPLKMYGNRPQRTEHVQNARETAMHAVKAIMTNSTEAYDYLPYFYSRVFDLSWQFFGDNVGECVVVGDFDPQLLAVWVENGKLLGVFMEHPSAEDTANMKVVARSQPAVDAEALGKCTSVQEAWKMIL